MGAWLLGLALVALSVAGVVRWPHPVWAAPIACAVLGFHANHRTRRTGRRGAAVLLGVLTLVLLVGAGALAEVAFGVASTT
ncbi:hypothetical protein [Lentzea aerocolonigenes]|uniref:hypothetical protein n=1 Tax=Lentzea aerocolonigenes TaxID=68170 RepID=UPI0004C422CD|nr:hypothetical protein [Lentzea aerocolonigenes]MCP2248834.1 hypothetical protein [Lentzea aerocolonigenes]